MGHGTGSRVGLRRQPRAIRTNVYIDGFNLYYGSLKGTPYRWLDLEALCTRLLPRNDVRRVRYFTARVSARPGQLHDLVHQNAYLRALATLPRVSIHLGHFLIKPATMPLADPQPGGPRCAEVLRTEEKGSDVNLATYLLADAFRKDAAAFAIVSNERSLVSGQKLCEVAGAHTDGPHQHVDDARSASSTLVLNLGSWVWCVYGRCG